MVQKLPTSTQPEVIYPDDDGLPMSNNTEQFRWIVIIKENLELLFAQSTEVFVAGDLLWYPVEGNDTIRQAPDVMVVFGRPKGKRGSYQQWLENHIVPQVVFEILSPGNRRSEMAKKLDFYDQYGVEEYYIYNPQKVKLTGLIRAQTKLEAIRETNGWVSPRLGIRFELTSDTLLIMRPDGKPFLSTLELDAVREQEHQRAEQEHQRAEQEHQRAEQERQRAEQEHQRAEQERQRADQNYQLYQDLLQKLQEKGINPEQL
jgi:Uma2 family endonuclease